MCDNRKENRRFGEGRDLTALICGHVSTLVEMCTVVRRTVDRVNEVTDWANRAQLCGPVHWPNSTLSFPREVTGLWHVEH